MAKPEWTVYLAGEIHSDWRKQIRQGVEAAGLPVTLLGPVTGHAPGLTHALEEVDAAALAVAETPQQVVGILHYAVHGRLP